MGIEKAIDQYIGDVVGGLIREAGLLRARCHQLEAALRESQAKVAELQNTEAAEHPSYELDT